MEIINNKSFVRKIIIAILIVLSFNFVAPTLSQAAKDEDSETLGEAGGVLLGPVIDLFAGICDSVMVILQVCMKGGEFKLSEWMVESDTFRSKGAASYGLTGSADVTKSIDEDDLDHGWLGLDTYNVPVITYSPEAIFANQVPGLEANFIKPKFQEDKSIAYTLQETISKWYNTLRNLVLVLLLSVLLYVGIRMMLTSIASDKAKYKQMLMDWVVAVCLLFFLHYIMNFTMTFVNIIAEGVGEQITGVGVNISDGTSFTTNLTGYCRMMIQYKSLGTRLIYLIFYIGLTILTVTFTWKYMKRAITMAFLTLMAPLVTLTYPIDKIGDGKAQAFNMWLKEYIFNALLQPFHLIIYSIFLGGSMAIAVDNPLYAILFLAFISPAEKILRKFFKFDQASTAGAGFAGGFGGAAAFNMVKGIMNRGAKGLSSGNSGSGGTKNNTIKQQQKLPTSSGPDGIGAFATGNGGANEANKYTGSETGEDDQRGIGQWAKDSWNESQLKQDMKDHTDYFKDLWGSTKIGQDMKDHTEYLNNIRLAAGQGIKNMAKKVPKPIRNTIKGFTGVVKGAAPGAIRFTRKLAGAAVMGTIGVAMGTAGDDLDDVWKMGMAGATLGFTAGPTFTDNIVSGINSAGEQTRYNYEAGVYGEEEAAQMQNDRQFVANQSYRNSVSDMITEQTGEKPTRAQLNEAMQVAAEYNRAGITNIKQINKSMILEKQLEEELRKSPRSMSEKEITRSARDQAMTIAQMANSIEPSKLRDPKERKKIQDSFARELMDKDKNMNSKAADAQASRIMAMVMQMKKK